MTTQNTDMPKDIAERIFLAKRDPWFFLQHGAYTLDQTDPNGAIKKFPCEDPNMRDYLRLYVRIWEKNNRVVVPKSRRMFMTWTNLLLHLHLAMFGVGRSVGIVSKKEEDSDELLRRCKFVYENIPEDFIPRKMLPKMEYKYGMIYFPETESWMKGFAQGADQLRQFTMTALMADEMGFWEHAKKAYSASMPTLEGGGRFTAISSPAPGFFKDLVLDRLDNSNEDIVQSEVKTPIPGVQIWRNKKNQFVVFQLHYSANEKKRDPKYIEEVKRSMPISEFRQEYELQWESFAGQPVYPDFDAQRHISTKEIFPELGLPLLRGWDFGLTPACVVAQLVEGQLRILCEFTAENMGAERFCSLVLPRLRMLYPGWGDQKKSWRDFIDPAGHQRAQTDESTCAEAMVRHGLAPAIGSIAFEARKTSVERLLIRQTRTGPGIIMDSSCKQLIDGFKGGYHYPEKAMEIEPNKLRPLKNEYSHPHDALQYLCSRIADFERKRGPGVATPSYFRGSSDNKMGSVAWQK